MLKKSGKFVPKCRLGGATLQSSLSNRKKLLILIISCITICALVLGVVFGVVKNNDGEDPTTALTGPVNTDYWDSDSTYYDTAWSGSGTSTDPFLIEEAADLAGLAYNVNNGSTYSGQYFRQTAPIDLSQHYWRSIGESSNSRPFSGNYDGGEFEISGLFAGIYQNSRCFFGYVSCTQDVEIKNITIVDSIFKGQDSAGIIGILNMASDSANFTLQNCYNGALTENDGNNVKAGMIGRINLNSSTGTITIQDCTNAGDITGYNTVGGIVAFINNTSSSATLDFINCHNTGNISGLSDMGGIIGSHTSYSTTLNIVNCSNSGTITSTGSVIGGILGRYTTTNNTSPTLNIESCYNLGEITATSNYVGGIAGYLTGSTAHVSINIESCYNRANISASGYVAGIVGNASSSISSTSSPSTWSGIFNLYVKNCYNTGNIQSSSSQAYTAGIVGQISQNAFANGAAIGSYARSANTSASIVSCFNTGTISNTSSESYINNIGGIVGYSYLNVSQSSYGTSNGSFALQNCYNVGNVTGQNLVSNSKGGIIGYAQASGSNSSRVTYSNTITNNYYGGACPSSIGGMNGQDRAGQAEYAQINETNFKTQSFFEDLSNWQAASPWDFTFTWKMDESVNDGFPYFIPADEQLDWWFADENYYDTNWAGSGTEDDPFLIEEAADLAGLSYAVYSVSSGNYNQEVFSGTYFRQTATIDMSAHYWQPIGGTKINYQYNYNYFCGIYDGNNQTISGLFTPSGSNYQGLFGYTQGATLQNINVEDSAINGAQYVGGIVGYATTTTISNCSYSGMVIGTQYVGGISGYYGSIQNCTNYGAIGGETAVGGINGYYGNVTSSHNAGSVAGSVEYVGGILGQGQSSSSVTNSYNTGNVSGNNYVGGINGGGSKVITSYNLGNVSGNEYVGGIVGVAGEVVYNNFNLGSVSGLTESIGGIVGGIEGASSIEEAILAGVQYTYSNYYGGNCENIGGMLSGEIAGATYSATLADDAKTLEFFQTVSNWQISYPWDFDFTWELSAGQNDGYPVLTGNSAVLLTVVSYDEGMLETEGWYGPFESIIYPDNSADGLLAAEYVLSKWMTPGQTIGQLPNTQDGDLTFDNFYSTYQSPNFTDEYVVTDQTVIEENTIIFAVWDLTSTWMDYRSSSLQMQGTDFLITSAEDLAFVAYEVSQGNSLYINGSYIQTQDIDLTGHYWAPIGTDEYPFAGNYDGNGFTIDGVTTYRQPLMYIDSSPTEDYVGLFGYMLGESVDNKSVIKNIGLVGTTIEAIYYAGGIAGYAVNIRFENCYNDGAFVTASSAGGCAGIVAVAKNCEIVECYNSTNIGTNSVMGATLNISVLTPQAAAGIVLLFEGTQIIDCYNEGAISGQASGGIGYQDVTPNSSTSTASPSTIEGSYNTGAVNGIMGSGGIAASIGVSGTVIDNCYNTGDVSSSLIMAGGIATSNAGTITNSYNSGTVTGGTGVGGIAGSNSGTISNTFNTGAIEAWGDASVGVDIIGAGITASNSGDVSNSYYGGDCGNIGGIGGSDTDGASYSSSIVDDAQSEEWFQNESVWNPDYPWNIGEDWFIVDGYPTLEAPITWLDDPSYYDHEYATGNGSEGNPYVITSNKELAGMAYLLLNYNDVYKTKHFKLATNVDMSEYYWVPIGTTNALAFAGHFDGGNYTITGLRAYAGWDGVGLFGTVIGTNASHAVIENVVMQNMRVTSNSYAGGVVGVGEYVEISNCRVVGETNTLKGPRAGGVIGYAMNSEVSDSYNNGTIEASGDYLGGVVGYANLSQVENCYATVSASFTGITRGVTTNADSGNVGGLVGGAESSTIANCFNAGPTSGSWGISGEGLQSMMTILSTGGIIGFAKTQAIVTDCYNLGLVSCDIMANGGGIAGKSDGATIQNCYNKGSLTSTTNLEGGIMAFGGIVGSPINSTILKCTNYADIDYYYAYAGGIAGWTIDVLLMMMGGDVNSYLENLTTTTIQNCYNYGNVETVIAGGIVCVAAKSEVIDCVNAGVVGFYDAVNRMYTDQAAGVAAMVVGDLTLNRVYNLGDIIGNNYVAGMIAMTQSLTGEIMTVNLNHCFNAGDIYGHGSNGAAGIIYEVVSTNLNITNSANVGDIHVILSNNGFYNRVRVSGLIGTNGGSGAGSNVGSITISNCIVKMGVYFDCNGASSIEENGGYVAGIGYELQTNSLVVANCAINITGIYYDDEDTSVNAVPDANVNPFFIYSVQEPSQVVSNTYALITNNTTGTENNVVLDNGGMDGNFVYVEGMFDGMAVPVNIYHIDGYITNTGILEYLQQTFNVQPFVAA